MTTTQRFLGAMMALMIAASTNAQSAPSPNAAVNIVLVHGALIDGSSWRGVYDVLTGDGYRVSIVQEPLTGLDEDVAATLVPSHVIETAARTIYPGGNSMKQHPTTAKHKVGTTTNERYAPRVPITVR